MARSTEHAQLTLRDYASVIRRRKWLVLFPMLLTALVAGVLSMMTPVKYRATAEVLVQLPPTAENVGSTGAVMSPRLIENELRAASGSELQAEVRQVVGPEPELSVAADESSDVFRFTAVSGGKRQAADAANIYAQMYIERQRSALISEYTARAAVIEQQLANEQAEGDDLIRIAEYEQELENLDVSIELARTSGSTLIDEATPPGAPFEPQTRRTVGFALIVGLLIGLGTAFLLEYLDTSIRDEDDLQAASGLPTLAVIPAESFDETDGRMPIATRDHPHSSSAEAYRGLRTSVQFLGLDQTLGSVQLTSPRPGEGKTTTAANLAIAAARGGQRVVLIDCDLRKPQVHNCFAIGNETGFTSVLLRKSSLQAAVVSAPDEPRLRILPSGPIPPNPSELLASERARSIIEALTEAVDLVVVDSPPVLPVADAVSISGLIDGVIVVAAAESTDRRAIAKSLDRFEQVDAPVIGTVLNRADPKKSVEYRYEYAPDERETTNAGARATDDDRARASS